MERRLFTKILLICGLNPLTVAQGLPRTTGNSKNLLLLGSAACNVGVTYAEDHCFDSVTLIDSEHFDNMDALKCFSFNTPDWVYADIDGFRYVPAIHLPSVPLSQNVIKHVNQLEGDLTILACLGKVTGSILCQSLQRVLLASNRNLHWVLTIPFSFEGSKKRQRALSIIEEIRLVSGKVHVLDLEIIREKSGNISLKQAWGRSDELIMDKLKSLSLWKK